MSVQVDAALYHQQVISKEQRAADISTMVSCLEGTCQVCWIRTGNFKPKGHIPFLQCRLPCTPSFVESANGWWTLKKQASLPRYQYCYWCGLPQAPFRPEKHPQPNKENAGPCCFADFVPIMCWIVFTDKQVFEEARKTFSGLAERMSIAQFTQWYQTDNNPTTFYNGLELALWLWQKYKPKK